MVLHFVRHCQYQGGELDRVQEVEMRANSVMCLDNALYLQLPKWQMESVVCISVYHFFSLSVAKGLIL